MRTFQVLLALTAVCAAVLAVPDSETRRQALFVRQQRQQPAAAYHLNRPENPLQHEPPRDQQGGSSVDEPSREYLPLPSTPQEKPRPFVPPVTPDAQPSRPRPQPETPRPVRPTPRPVVTQPPQEIDSEGQNADNNEHHHHGAHINDIDVTCAKDQMTIRLEFSGPFEGVIYSKGFYNQPSCRYLLAGSGQSRAEFTVRLDSCGTQFVDEFATGGQAYLENVLVLQNEVGIQEVWDTIRRVRCLWAGNIHKALSAALSVDVLDQEIVTFSGDTASAKLDIQIGKGPFAAPASGLVKIGEDMTLVISVEGDPGFEVTVGECVAHAGDRDTGGPVVKLTDSEGCPLKPKLFPSPFTLTRETGGSSASIIAYAYFQAFKFPDQMELYIECEVELCKTGCRVCPRGNSAQALNARRKRASNETAYSQQESIADPVRLMRKVTVVTEDDLAQLENAAGNTATIINVSSAQPEGVCLSIPAFVTGSVFLLVLLLSSSMVSASLWLKNQRLQGCGM